MRQKIIENLIIRAKDFESYSTDVHRRVVTDQQVLNRVYLLGLCMCNTRVTLRRELNDGTPLRFSEGKYLIL